MSNIFRFSCRSALTVTVCVAAIAAWREDRSQRAENWARQAVGSIRERNLDSADAAIRKAISLSGSSHYLGLQGLISGLRGADSFSLEPLEKPTLEQQGFLREALTAYNSALATNPDDDLFWHNRGWIRLLLGENPSIVIRDFERAIRIDGGTPEYRVSAGLTYERLGRPDRAIAEYAAAVMSEPGLLESDFAEELNTRQPDLWRAVIQRSATQLQRGSEMPIRARRAALYVIQGSREDALRELRDLTQAAPQLPRPWANLSRVYLLYGRIKDAGTCLDKALALDSRDGYIWLQASALAKERGDQGRAKLLLLRASRGLRRHHSPHSLRAGRVYQTAAVVGDDLLPPGLLESCQVSTSNYYRRGTSRRSPQSSQNP